MWPFDGVIVAALGAVEVSGQNDGTGCIQHVPNCEDSKAQATVLETAHLIFSQGELGKSHG